MDQKTFFFCILFLSCYCYSVQETPPYENDPRPECINDMNKEYYIRQRRIIGGEDADVNSFRFVAEILFTGIPFCAAFIITDKHVLTAAHCFYKEGTRITYKLNRMLLVIGDYNVMKLDEVKHHMRIIYEAHIHPEYDDVSVDNDIAVLKFEPALSLGKNLKATILPPPNTEPPEGSTVVAWGWGVNAFEKGNRSYILQKVDIPYLVKEVCKKMISRFTDNMFCAGRKGKITCRGDSGSSLLLKVDYYYVSFAITSHGFNCGEKMLPSIYTDVSRYINWIYELTKEADCKPAIHSKENYPHRESKESNHDELFK
ncbi:trypsin-like [Centruroides sculpturatus]|uniref:trypsin-like n=1 Tax=Centruroides sculpturatus TaxID=218467 RepID=UPI000C6D2CC2|nr:trypsin-like [Centruroides sculpturatus]